MIVHILGVGQEPKEIRVLCSPADTQLLVPSINAAVTRHGYVMTRLRGIGVIQGAERFSVARVVVVAANALAWSVRVPIQNYTPADTLDHIINDLMNSTFDPAKLLEPVYSGEPRITLEHEAEQSSEQPL